MSKLSAEDNEFHLMKNMHCFNTQIKPTTVDKNFI